MISEIFIKNVGTSGRASFGNKIRIFPDNIYRYIQNKQI